MESALSTPYGPSVPVALPGYGPAPYAPAPVYGPPTVTIAPPGWASVPAPPGARQASKAAILFFLCAIRDFFMIFFVIADGPFQMGWAGLPFRDYWVLALVPACGMAACAYCFARVRNPKDPEKTTVVALVAFGASSFPGIAFIGPVGLLLSSLGLWQFFKSRRLLRVAESTGFQGAPQNA